MQKHTHTHTQRGIIVNQSRVTDRNHTHTLMSTQNTDPHIPLGINTHLVVQALSGYIREEGFELTSL